MMLIYSFVRTVMFISSASSVWMCTYLSNFYQTWRGCVVSSPYDQLWHQFSDYLLVSHTHKWWGLLCYHCDTRSQKYLFKSAHHWSRESYIPQPLTDYTVDKEYKVTVWWSSMQVILHTETLFLGGYTAYFKGNNYCKCLDFTLNCWMFSAIICWVGEVTQIDL